MLNIFKFLKREKRGIGIDIGTSAIKMVELKGRKGCIKLSAYGEFQRSIFPNKQSFQSGPLYLLEEEAARIIKLIKNEAQIKSRKAVMSIPVFSSFFTTITLPSLPKEEITDAISFQARQYIPVPISEVVLDWSILKSKPPHQNFGSGGKKEKDRNNIDVLVVAVPNEVVNRYVRIAQLADIELSALEVETFSLARSFSKEDDSSFLIIDFGANSTSISIIRRGSVLMAYSLNFSSARFTESISKFLELEPKKAEELKRKQGLQDKDTIAPIILPLIDRIISEVEKIVDNYRRKQKKELRIKKVIIAGGMANLPGLKNYLEEKLKKEIEIGNPFLNIKTLPILSPVLKQIGPSFAVAVGIAMRELE